MGIENRRSGVCCCLALRGYSCVVFITIVTFSWVKTWKGISLRLAMGEISSIFSPVLLCIFLDSSFFRITSF